MNNNDITVFAETTFRNKHVKFGIKRDDRRRHMYLIGKTGMGKSTILENMIVEDIRKGHGVAVVDPHGDLAEKIIDFIPSDRINDVIYFNPADINHPIAFNVVEHVESHYRHLISSGLIGVFQKLWADSWGPRLEYILRNSILAILDYPGSTLLAVTRMLSDKKFRKKVIEKIQDPVVKSFWVNEFAGYNDKFASEAVSPIQNKVGQFLSSSLIRNIVGQVKSTIDMRKIMDEGKILILNLSKGRIGEDNSALLGAMMITKIQLAAMSRVDVPENERKDFFLYVDEFQNFTSDSFANILSEARKYRLNLILAHQYIEQLEENVKYAVFGNVGTIILFRVGATDAESLVLEFTPTFTEEDIVNLPKYEIYLKLMIDGVASEPFSARGLPPLSEEEKTGNTEKVIMVSRERYAKDRLSVEDKINRWHMNDDDMSEDAKPKETDKKNVVALKPIEAIKEPQVAREAPKVYKEIPKKEIQRAPAQNPSLYKFETKCFRCDKSTSTSFKPDGIRPVYCKDCLSIIKEEKKAEAEKRKLAKKDELEQLNKREISNRNQRITPPEIKKPFVAPSSCIKKEDDNVAPEVSLVEALKMPPVSFGNKTNDFDHKNIQAAEPATDMLTADETEENLKEGEEIKF
jgi:CxxC-x17-CxxC domain-containing protein